MTKKIFISRPLPKAVLSAAALLGDITVREDTSAMTEDEMVASLVTVSYTHLRAHETS